jgi:hypothetical protein
MATRDAGAASLESVMKLIEGDHSAIQDQVTRLTTQQQQQYRDRGYHFPVRAFDGAEAAESCESFLCYMREKEETLKHLLPREKLGFLAETHFFLHWVYRLVSHPRVLDAVESVLGPNITVWNSHWFPKFPGDRSYVSWHQDAPIGACHRPKLLRHGSRSPRARSRTAACAWFLVLINLRCCHSARPTPQTTCSPAARKSLWRWTRRRPWICRFMPESFPFITSVLFMVSDRTGRQSPESGWQFGTFRRTSSSLAPSAISFFWFAAKTTTATSRSWILRNMTWLTGRARCTARPWPARCAT